MNAPAQSFALTSEDNNKQLWSITFFRAVDARPDSVKQRFPSSRTRQEGAKWAQPSPPRPPARAPSDGARQRHHEPAPTRPRPDAYNFFAPRAPRPRRTPTAPHTPTDHPGTWPPGHLATWQDDARPAPDVWHTHPQAPPKSRHQRVAQNVARSGLEQSGSTKNGQKNPDLRLQTRARSASPSLIQPARHRTATTPGQPSAPADRCTK